MVIRSRAKRKHQTGNWEIQLLRLHRYLQKSCSGTTDPMWIHWISLIVVREEGAKVRPWNSVTMCNEFRNTAVERTLIVYAIAISMSLHFSMSENGRRRLSITSSGYVFQSQGEIPSSTEAMLRRKRNWPNSHSHKFLHCSADENVPSAAATWHDNATMKSETPQYGEFYLFTQLWQVHAFISI